jgi:hypothetical protein
MSQDMDFSFVTDLKNLYSKKKAQMESKLHKREKPRARLN